MKTRSVLLMLSIVILISSPLSALSVLSADHSPAIRSWQDMKFGMFIHWGLYSVAGGVWKGQKVEAGYSEQIMAWAPASREEYAKLSERFTADKWDPDAVCKLAKAAGMRYIVLTSKHHDGFCLFNTGTTDFNSVEMTPGGRDIVKGLAEACKRNGLRLGLYFSLIDWAHPDGNTPEPSANSNPISPALEKVNTSQLEELLSDYGDLVELWFDMSTPTPRQSRLFADTVHRLQPGCLVSGRVWNHQGDFTVMGDNQIPSLGIREPWQSPESIYAKTWGYRSWQERKNLEEKISEKIRHLSRVVSLGGVFLLNIGPRGDGSIVEFEADVLKGVGDWLRVHEEAVFGTDSQPFFEQLPWGYATSRENVIYLHIHSRPLEGNFSLPGLQNNILGARIMGSGEKLSAIGKPGAWQITCPEPEKNMKWPVAVVEVELEGAPLILPSLPPQVGDSYLRIPIIKAYTRYDRNGRGYMEQKITSGYTWDFSVPLNRTYKIDVEVFSPKKESLIEIEFNGRKSRHTVNPADAKRDIVLVSPGSYTLSTGKAYSLTVQSPDYVPGTPVGLSLAGLRISE
jgi:alpha-L-fucosidase